MTFFFLNFTNFKQKFKLNIWMKKLVLLCFFCEFWSDISIWLQIGSTLKMGRTSFLTLYLCRSCSKASFLASGIFHLIYRVFHNEMFFLDNDLRSPYFQENLIKFWYKYLLFPKTWKIMTNYIKKKSICFLSLITV